MKDRGKMSAVSEARVRAADAFAAGLRVGDMLEDEDIEAIRDFRAYLPEALVKRRMQLQEEPHGWRVIRAPFTFEATVASGARVPGIVAVA